MDAGVKERASLRAGGREATKMISEAEARLDFRGAHGNTNVKCSHSFLQGANRRLRIPGHGGPRGGER